MGHEAAPRGPRGSIAAFRNWGAVMTPLLEVKDLNGWYGESHVLHGVNFHVNEGEVVTLLGRNGAGRTSTMRSIMGLIGSRKGSIKVRGVETIGMSTHRIARLGLGYCPEERGIFSSLSAEENLMLPPQLAEGGMSVEQIYTMFPNLRERASSQGTRLSGGEQQMLAVARALMSRPKVLLLDEPSLGLAPIIVQDLFRRLGTLNKEQGITMLVVEQNANLAFDIADRAYVLEVGEIALSGTADELRSDDAVRRAYLGY